MATTYIPASPTAVEAWERLSELRSQKREIERALKSVTGTLLDEFGRHQNLVLDDDRILTRKLVRVPEHVVREFTYQKISCKEGA